MATLKEEKEMDMQFDTIFDSDEAENEYMKAGSGLVRVAGTEAEALAAEGYLPCGLSQTGRVCPDCGSLLGHFRSGFEGRMYYNPVSQQSFLSDEVRTDLYFCRKCRRTYA